MTHISFLSLLQKYYLGITQSIIVGTVMRHCKEAYDGCTLVFIQKRIYNSWHRNATLQRSIWRVHFSIHTETKWNNKCRRPTRRVLWSCHKLNKDYFTDTAGDASQWTVTGHGHGLEDGDQVCPVTIGLVVIYNTFPAWSYDHMTLVGVLRDFLVLQNSFTILLHTLIQLTICHYYMNIISIIL